MRWWLLIDFHSADVYQRSLSIEVGTSIGFIDAFITLDRLHRRSLYYQAESNLHFITTYKGQVYQVVQVLKNDHENRERQITSLCLLSIYLMICLIHSLREEQEGYCSYSRSFRFLSILYVFLIVSNYPRSDHYRASDHHHQEWMSVSWLLLFTTTSARSFSLFLCQLCIEWRNTMNDFTKWNNYQPLIRISFFSHIGQ